MFSAVKAGRISLSDSGAAERSVKPQPKSGRPVASSAGSIDDRNFLGVQKSEIFGGFWPFRSFLKSRIWPVDWEKKEELHISTFDIVSKSVLQEMFAGYMNMPPAIFQFWSQAEKAREEQETEALRVQERLAEQDLLARWPVLFPVDRNGHQLEKSIMSFNRPFLGLKSTWFLATSEVMVDLYIQIALVKVQTALKRTFQIRSKLWQSTTLW